MINNCFLFASNWIECYYPFRSLYVSLWLIKLLYLPKLILDVPPGIQFFDDNVLYLLLLIITSAFGLIIFILLSIIVLVIPSHFLLFELNSYISISLLNVFLLIYSILSSESRPRPCGLIEKILYICSVLIGFNHPLFFILYFSAIIFLLFLFC